METVPPGLGSETRRACHSWLWLESPASVVSQESGAAVFHPESPWQDGAAAVVGFPSVDDVFAPQLAWDSALQAPAAPQVDPQPVSLPSSAAGFVSGPPHIPRPGI